MASDASDSKKVTWTRELNLDLAKYMERHPNIWDRNHPKFSNIGLRDETFARYAADRDLDWQAVKSRWTNIRSTFSFYMRKVEARKKIGREFKVGWFLWKPCIYLYKVHRVKPQKKSAEKSSEEEKTIPTNDNDISNDAISSDNDDNDDSHSNDASQTANASCQGIINNLSSVLKAVQNDAYDVDNSRTRHAAVGEAVTSMLSQLDSYDAAQMTQKILEILAEYDEKNPMNPNGLSYDSDTDVVPKI